MAYGYIRTLPTITGSHSDFPLLLVAGSFPSEALNGPDAILNGGGNLRAYTDNTKTVQLPLQIIRFVTGASPDVLVRVGVNASSLTTIYLEADDTETTQPPFTDTYGRNSVWNNRYKSVLNFEEGVSGNWQDSSGNQLDSQISLGSFTSQEGIQGTELFFDGSSTIDVNVNSSLKSQSNYYCELICSPSDNTSTVLLGNMNGEAGNTTHHLLTDVLGSEQGNPKFNFFLTGGSSSSKPQVGSSWQQGDTVWSSFSYVDSVESKVHLDGILRDTTSQSTSFAGGSSNVTLGGRGTNTLRFKGYVSELRLSNYIPADNYIATLKANEEDPTNWGTSGEWVSSQGEEFILDVDGYTSTYSGIDVDLIADRGIVLDSSSFSYLGSDFNLSFDRYITTDKNLFSYTGGDINLLSERNLHLSGHNFTYASDDIDLLMDRVISFQGYSSSYSGQSVGLLLDRDLILQGSLFSYSSNHLSLVSDKVIDLGSGIYNHTSSPLSLVYKLLVGFTLNLDGASLSYIGGDTSVLYDRLFSLDTSSFTYTPSDLSIHYERVLDTLGGIFLYGSSDISLLSDRVITIDTEDFNYSGSSLGLNHNSGITTLIDGYTVNFEQDNITINYQQDIIGIQYGRF